MVEEAAQAGGVTLLDPVALQVGYDGAIGRARVALQAVAGAVVYGG